MTKILKPLIRIAALAILANGFAFVGESRAAPTDMSNPSNFTTDQTQPPSPVVQKSHAHRITKDDSPEAMQKRLETRIQTLHDKLGITKEQEGKWNDVAQAMRDNETVMSQLIVERHQNIQGRSAIDDLQSYENIAQAHTDGLKKLIPVFQTLYNDMSDDQKKNADYVFGRFEGHHGAMSAKKHV